MNLEAEPIIAALVNMLVGLLVSKGIIDSAAAPILSMNINNILAAIVTIALGGYSIYKTVDAYKHKVTTQAHATSSVSTPTVTTNAPSIDMIGTQPSITQTGLPFVK